MKSVSDFDRFLEGHLSLEKGDGWIRPWRIPFEERDLYPHAQEALLRTARDCSGVRLRFETDAEVIALSFLPLETRQGDPNHTLDLTVGPDRTQTVPIREGATSARFDALPTGQKIVDLWLPHDTGIALADVSINPGAAVRPVPSDSRPRWVTYGSSLTHCRRAHSPARTWPALVARQKGFHLTNLGFAGNCCLEIALGLILRNLPADLITLKLGINCIKGHLSERTYGPAVLGLARLIRERHPRTPLALISPMAYPPRERDPNPVGYTIEGMRADLAEVAERLRRNGDPALFDFDGRELFNEEEIAAYTIDRLHPNADGIELMADHFLERILPNIRMPA